MSRWIGPIIVALIAGVGGYAAALHWYPDVLMRIASHKLAGGETNTMYHAGLTRAELQPVVRPSPDLLYSSCAFDLSDHPLRVTAAPVPGHYSSVSVYDSHTNVARIVNDEALAGRPKSFVLAREGQVVPPGADVVRVPGATGIVLQRVLVRDAGDAAAVDAARRQTNCAPLT
jgi:uncharacterized membrane protein